MRSGLRLIFAWQPDGRGPVYEGLTFHCEAGLAAWLGGKDAFDPATCPLEYRHLEGWEQAEAWLRERG